MLLESTRTLLEGIVAAFAEGKGSEEIAAEQGVSQQFVEWITGSDSFRLMLENHHGAQDQGERDQAEGREDPER